MKRTLLILIATATAAAGWSVHADVLRVEIPISDSPIRHYETLPLKQLLVRRAHVDPSRYELRAVLLRTRSSRDGHAQLLLNGYRSQRVYLRHPGDAAAVRIRSPRHGQDGPWQLRIGGDVRVDRLVAVLEPRHRYVHARRPVLHPFVRADRFGPRESVANSRFDTPPARPNADAPRGRSRDATRRGPVAVR